MAQAVVIDLGYPDEAPPPGYDEPRPRRRWRPGFLVLALLATLLTTADSTGPRLIEVLTAPIGAGGFDLTDDALYTLSGTPPSAVTAYGLAEGRRRWERQGQVGVVVRAGPGPVALVMGQFCIRPSTFQTVAVDARSGTPVWSHTGVAVMTVASGQTVLLKRPADAAACDRMGPGLDPADAGTPVVWDAVDLRTGELRWTLPVPAGSQVHPAFDDRFVSPWLAMVSPDGTVSTRETATGRLLAAARLPELVSGPVVDPYELPLQLVGPGIGPVTVVGDLVVTMRRTSVDGAFEVAGYARDTLTRLWRTALGPPSSRRVSGDYKVVDCGPVVCLGNGDDLVALDATTGVPRWRASGVFVAGSDRYGVFAVPARLSVVRYRVIAATTGRLLVDLGDWGLEARVAGRPDLLLSLPYGGRTWFQRLDLRTMRAVLLGSAPGLYGFCAAVARYVACATHVSTVRVWRLT
jgi:outer membrane protein assembly factor BamB